MQKLLPVLIGVLTLIVFAPFNAHSSSRGIAVLPTPGVGSHDEKETIPIYDRMIAVIGIDRYRDLSPDHQLSYAVKDAKGMAEVLRANYPFEQVITLLDEEATKSRIMKVLQGDLSMTGPEDAVLIYFAGHGITRSTTQGDLGYLIPYDGSLKMDEMYKNISMQQIKSDVSPLIPAKHVLFIAEACFGGLLLSARSTGLEAEHEAAYLREITREPVRQIITAGGKDSLFWTKG